MIVNYIMIKIMITIIMIMMMIIYVLLIIDKSHSSYCSL